MAERKQTRTLPRQSARRQAHQPVRQEGRQEVDEQANRLFFRFFQASNTLQTMSTQALDDFKITSTQWSVMGALSRPVAEVGMTITELSQYLLVSRQNLAGVLTRLEERGLIDRTEGTVHQRLLQPCTAWPQQQRSRRVHPSHLPGSEEHGTSLTLAEL
jgi:CRP-like cAMP-binding protein